MKPVQDKNGNEIEVADDTPCHAGKNGALPVMLDAVLDAEIFEWVEKTEREHIAEAPARAEAKVRAKRRVAYGTPEEQLEFLAKNGINAFQARRAQIDLNIGE